MTNYGKQFKEIREKKGLTLNDVSKKSKVAKSTLSRFENGETQLAVDKFIAALKAMGMTFSEFESGEVRVAASGDILLPLETTETRDEMVEKLETLEKFYNNSDSLGLLNYQMTEEHDAILRILSKVFLINLGLKMELPQSDISFLQTYFLENTNLTIGNLKILIYLEEFLPNSTETIDFSNFSSQQRLDLVSIIIDKLQHIASPELLPYVQLLQIISKKE